mmetsp:Transcript_2775/g.5913  ORF Transcript_2775/g.5913 Transcript_2775/m.5913 type:complete len:282 (+) Transcript_2775:197-1042(+)
MLMHMEKGSAIDWCSNIEDDANVIGTLLIQLPSVFSGGKMSVFYGDDDEDVDEDNTSVFTLGTTTGGLEFSPYFICHYSDCQYQIEEIKSGSRMLLRYSLCYQKEGTKPSACLLRSSMVPLEWSLSLLPRADRLVLTPLAKGYNPNSLAKHGINALAGTHRAKAEAIKATGKGWKVLVVNAKKMFSSSTSGYNDDMNYSTTSVESIYDEQGNNETTPNQWLQKIINFTPVKDPANIVAAYHNSDCDSYYSNPHVEEDDKDGEGMVLTASKQVEDNWGKRAS